METVLDQARALGEVIAGHPRTKAFFAAGAALRADAGARGLLDSFQKHADYVHKLEDDNKPVEVADKRKLAELQTRMASNETIKVFMRSQADYIDLMNRVNRAMEAPLMARQQAPTAGAGPAPAPAAGGRVTDA